jgi:hypothetical protein
MDKGITGLGYGGESTLLLKQFLPGFPGLGDLFLSFSIGLRSPEGEEIAEVGLFSIRDVFALGLAALIVGMGIIKGTVEAGMEVAPAVGACSASLNPFIPIELLSTPVAYLHDSPLSMFGFAYRFLHRDLTDIF